MNGNRGRTGPRSKRGLPLCGSNRTNRMVHVGDGKAVTETTTMAEAGGTAGVKTSMAAEPAGMGKGTSGRNTRVAPDTATKTTVTTREISEDKVDCQVPETGETMVDRSCHTTTTTHEISEDNVDCRVPEEEMQRPFAQLEQRVHHHQVT